MTTDNFHPIFRTRHYTRVPLLSISRRWRRWRLASRTPVSPHAHPLSTSLLLQRQGQYADPDFIPPTASCPVFPIYPNLFTYPHSLCISAWRFLVSHCNRYVLYKACTSIVCANSHWMEHEPRNSLLDGDARMHLWTIKPPRHCSQCVAGVSEIALFYTAKETLPSVLP